MRRDDARLRVGAAALLALALVTLVPPPGAAQSQSQDDEGVTLGANLVLLDVSVVDKSNRPVFEIPKERFSILEDGVPQQIDFFSKELAPVSIALVLDTSGSMRPKLDTVVRAASTLVHRNKGEDEAAVIEFKDEVALLEDLTTEERDVDDALSGLTAVGQSALLDAIAISAEYLQREGRNRRKALVVVTDGVERGSYYTPGRVIDRLRDLDVRLYLVGFTVDLESSSGLFKKSVRGKAEELLNRLAQETGGKAFFPQQLPELEGIADQIAVDLRTVYAIGYYSTNTNKDGSFRKVDVKVSGSASLQTRTRSGYYAEK